MAETNLKHKVIKGTFWQLCNTLGNQGISLIVSIVLARFIMPSQYGLIAMLTVFIAISQCFISCGFPTALIRKTDRTDIDCSSVFYFNIVISVTCYLILAFCAPFISDFYEMPELTLILRISAIGLIVSALGAIQTTLMNAELNFKATAKCSVISNISSGIIGIVLAYNDWQVWALVSQSLISQLLYVILIWNISTWRPLFKFSIKSIKEFFAFGSKLMMSGLLDTIYGQIYSITIGKFYSAADLGLYNRARGFAGLMSQTPTSILSSVAYPTLCKMQDDNAYLAQGYRRMLRLSAFIVFPLCLGLSAIAYPFINILLTEKWLPAAELLQIIGFSLMWYPIHAINLNLLQVKGRSDLFFRLEVIKKILGVSIMCITIPLGIKAMCYGMVFSSIICLVINTHYTGKLIHLGFRTQMGDLMPSLILSIIMFAVSTSITYVLGNGFISLITATITGIIIYCIPAWVLNFPELKEITNLIKERKITKNQ